MHTAGVRNCKTFCILHVLREVRIMTKVESEQSEYLMMHCPLKSASYPMGHLKQLQKKLKKMFPINKEDVSAETS